MAPLSQLAAKAIANLRAYTPPHPSVYHSLPFSRRAAVLLLLFADREGELRVVLTLRSSNLSSYAGQVSLPGGKADTDSETPFETARREAHEEIGLPPQNRHLPRPWVIEHLCELPTNLARTELGVRPCVAFLHTGDTQNDEDAEQKLIPRLNAGEVQEVFTAPFQKFLTDGHESGGEGEGWYQGNWIKWHSMNWKIHNFYMPRKRVIHLEGAKPNAKSADENTKSDEDSQFRIWGLTARILVDAARIAFARDPAFSHNPGFGEEELIKSMVEKERFEEKQSSKSTQRL